MISELRMKQVIDNIKKNVGDREVVLCGKSFEIKEYLNTHGFSVNKIFTGNPTLLADKEYHYYPLKELGGQIKILYSFALLSS